MARGAPFDENNIFTRDSVDGGKLDYSQPNSLFTRLEGGGFSNVLPTNDTVSDCGLLPKVGTATYKPDPYAGPNGPNIGQQDG